MQIQILKVLAPPPTIAFAPRAPALVSMAIHMLALMMIVPFNLLLLMAGVAISSIVTHAILMGLGATNPHVTNHIIAALLTNAHKPDIHHKKSRHYHP